MSAWFPAADPGGTAAGERDSRHEAPAHAPRRSRRPSLVTLVALIACVVVLLGSVVTALIAVQMVRSAAQQEARKALARQADVVTSLLDAGRAPAADGSALRVLRQQDTPVARVTVAGVVRGDAMPRQVIAPRLDAVRDGQPQSFSTTFRGRRVMVEARPLADGGAIVLARYAATATGPITGLLGRELVALAVGLVVAVGAAIALSLWLVRPLKSTAKAAGRLAAGDRDIRLQPGGTREVAQVAESVNSLAGALQGSEARQREFLLSVSHELRTPLTAIRGFGESLADDVVTEPDDVRAVGETIVGESQRLERLVGDLLDLARLGADDFRLDLTDFDLTALLRSAAAVWRARAEAVGVRFTAEFPSAEVPVRADPARIRQVVDGLAENALRVTPAGSPLVLALTSAAGEAVLSVRDGGPGLSESDMAVAFERSALYERYRGVRKVGTGLGLALVKALVERHGGQVAVSAAPEGGACFTVRLPLGARS